MKFLVTGYAGFIGSNLVKKLFEEFPDCEIMGYDAFTYAARPYWLNQWMDKNKKSKQFTQFVGNICNQENVMHALDKFRPNYVFHLAAESHVCKSIEGPRAFVESNINGTFELLEAYRKVFGREESRVFHHVSTDEVFGSLEIDSEPFSETTRYDPKSPYAASKAASDHLVMAYNHTYGLNTRITNCTNNFGYNQHEEKLIPKIIKHRLMGKPVTLYGSGEQVRDWLWVEDHCEAIISVAMKGNSGSTYCVGGNLEMSNLEVVKEVDYAMSQIIGRPFTREIIHTNDRPSDDFRYAMDTSKIQFAIGWRPAPELFRSRLIHTVKWYMQNEFKELR